MSSEETPLLPVSPAGKTRTPRTPLPKLQLSIIMLIQICEPLASQSIYPYINQLVRELDITGGDEKKVGYYAGLIESLFFLTEAMTVLQWSRASDRVGRKPVLILGLFGVAASILCFGLSRTFWTLVLSRCLCGLLNGNIGVMKSAMGDLTDKTNRADGFAYLPIVWATGASIGPLIGGTTPGSFPRTVFRSLLEGISLLPALSSDGKLCVSLLFRGVCLFRRDCFLEESDAAGFGRKRTCAARYTR